jgi:hypothetical protein
MQQIMETVTKRVASGEKFADDVNLSRAAEVLLAIPDLFTNKQTATNADGSVDTKPTVPAVINEFHQIAAKLRPVVCNVDRWRKDEISGKQASSNIFRFWLELNVGFAGAVGGAVLGSAIMPGPGTLIGVVVGCWAGTKLADTLADRLTAMFDIPKEKALENAYTFLGVEMTATDDEILAKFNQLSLECECSANSLFPPRRCKSNVTVVR